MLPSRRKKKAEKQRRFLADESLRQTGSPGVIFPDLEFAFAALKPAFY